VRKKFSLSGTKLNLFRSFFILTLVLAFGIIKFLSNKIIRKGGSINVNNLARQYWPELVEALLTVIFAAAMGSGVLASYRHIFLWLVTALLIGKAFAKAIIWLLGFGILNRAFCHQEEEENWW
jgi:hypothetical protein